MLFRLKLLLLSASAAALGFCGWMLWFALSPIDLAAPDSGILDSPGPALRGATRQIIEAGLPMPGWKFVLLARANWGQRRHQGGQLSGIGRGDAPPAGFEKSWRGEYAQAEILLVEGWNFRQMREALNAHADLKHDSASLSEAQIMTKLGAAEVLPEGMFFPDTYVSPRGSKRDLAVAGARAPRHEENNSSPPGPDAPRICR